MDDKSLKPETIESVSAGAGVTAQSNGGRENYFSMILFIMIYTG